MDNPRRVGGTTARRALSAQQEPNQGSCGQRSSRRASQSLWPIFSQAFNALRSDQLGIGLSCEPLESGAVDKTKLDESLEKHGIMT
jgi:hypothetical protein